MYASSSNPAFIAAARRSECPGVIELTGKMIDQQSTHFSTEGLKVSD
jgi:citrate lyase beta subunit